MRNVTLLLSASALALTWGNSALAQTKSADDSQMLETVVVTGERRNENLQTTAISATVLSGTDLIDKGILKVDDLQFNAPAMTINNFGQGVDFNIRGVGKGEHNTQTLTGVITYRDDVATFQGYFQGEPYFDIASVEILRGPQGTFVGQNAIGGAVFVKTNNPQIGGGWNGYVTASYGNYNETKIEGAVNIPISDKFAARLSLYGDARGSFFSISDRDPADACPGFKYAGCKPGYNPGDQRIGVARLSLLWTPTERLTVSGKVDYDYLDFGAFPGNAYWKRFKNIPATGADFLTCYPPPTSGQPAHSGVCAGSGYVPGGPNPYYSDPFKVQYNYPQLAMDRFIRGIVKVDYEFPNGITLRSVSQYAKGNTNWKTDLDLTDLGSPSTTSPNYWAKNFSFYDIAQETLASQEINLISPDTGRFTWVVGLTAQSDIYDFPQNPAWWIAVPPNTTKVPTVPAQTSDLWGQNFTAAYAGFAQVGYKLTDSLQIQLGGRYSISTTGNNVTWNQYGDQFTVTPRTKSPSGVSAGFAKFYSLDYKATVNWKVNDNHFLYAFIATGFKPGGLNGPFAFDYDPVTFAQIHIVPEPFGEEHTTSYEAGWKATMLDGHLRTQLSTYYNEYKGFIVTILYPSSAAGFVFAHATEVNDPKPTIAYGLELEADAVFGDFTFGAGLGLMHDSLGAFYANDARLPSGINTKCDPTTGGNAANCVNLKGHAMTYAPDVTYNLSAEYRFHLQNGDRLTPRATFGHQNPQWGSLFGNASLGDKLSARNLLGAQLEWTRGDWVVTAYGTNLTDQHYVGATISGIDMPGAPRQYGIRLLKVF